MEAQQRYDHPSTKDQPKQPPHANTLKTRPPPPGSAAPAAATASEQQNDAPAKKRKLDATGFQDSVYFKLRATVRDLRPYFLQVIHAQNFVECKAAHDIRLRMNFVLELYKQLKAGHTSSRTGKSTEQNKPNTVVEKTRLSESTSRSMGILHKKAESETPSKPPDQTPKVPESLSLGAKVIEGLHGIRGSFIVGGSPLGWNFLTYASGEPVYYGVTRETWLSKQQPKSNPRCP